MRDKEYSLYSERKDERSTGWKLAVYMAKLADRLVSSVISGALILVLLFTVLSITDLSGFNARGMEEVKDRDLGQLKRINPDTVAWLQLDGTHIDNPVVRGRDNFEYLDLDFHRNFYAGGTLFLDYRNSDDFSDGYNVIHGHHMSGGAMFGDLDRFLEESFLEERHSGTLKTEKADYHLEVVAAGTADAYNTEIYNVEDKQKVHIGAIMRSAAVMRKKKLLRSMLGNGPKKNDPDTYGKKKILVLSTCTGAMDDSRTIVVCIMDKEIKKGDVADSQDDNDDPEKT